MTRFKINGLRWWITGQRMPGSMVNDLVRRGPAIVRTAKPHELELASGQLVLHRQVAPP